MPSKDRPPSFQFYPRDFITSRAVAIMTPEARGGYILLLCHAWLAERPGYLPDDDQALAALSGLGERWNACRDSIRLAFKPCMLKGCSMLAQHRLLASRQAQVAFHRQASSGGVAAAAKLNADQRMERAKKAANARWDAKRMLTDANTASASASALDSDSPALQSLSPDSSPKPQGRKSNTLGPRASHSPFAQPSRGEVADYCAERLSLGKPRVDPDAWLDHYASNGWRVGKSPMRDWRAAVRTWERNGLNGHAPARPGFNAKGGLTADAIGAFAKHLRETEARDGKG